MRFLLDTTATVALLRGDAVFVARLRGHAPGDFGLSAIVAHELFYGAFRSTRREANLARVEGLRFEVVAFDAEDARAAGAVRAALAAGGTPIGPHDVLIAGQALARGLVLVTHNTREFARVEGLRVEDWGWRVIDPPCVCYSRPRCRAGSIFWCRMRRIRMPPSDARK